jgi:hypothetical protein
MNIMFSLSKNRFQNLSGKSCSLLGKLLVNHQSALGCGQMSVQHEIEGKHRQSVSRSGVLVSCSEGKTRWELALQDIDRSGSDICPSCTEAIRNILQICSSSQCPTV